MKLWAADPHQFGPGKTHIVDPTDESKTYCGRFLSAIPGREPASGEATCRICRDAVVRRPEMERQRQEWDKRRAELEAQKADEDRQWRAWYESYLRSPEWAVRRAKVMQRAGGICEGCLVETATEVHHVTYRHVGNELLWELRAICRGCHQRVTDLDREAKR